jgi:tetratricopeptide (TPR) repeat protein
LDTELIALGGAAAMVFREQPYELVKMEMIGQGVDLPRTRGRPAEGTARSHAWVYHWAGSKGGAAVLAGLVAWNAFRQHDADIGVGNGEPVNTIRAAKQLVTTAFDFVLTFVREERALLGNVRRGLEELSAANDTPLKCDPEVGPIIDAAHQGRCALFSAWLAPILGEACSPVLMLSTRELRDDAEKMSDLLASKSMSGDDAIHVQARALCDYWFIYCIVGRAGPTAEQRERAEHDVYSGTAGKLPLARLAGSLLRGRHDLPAAGATFVQAADEFREQERWADASDSLSRGGLAYLYAGDWAAAEELFAASVALTEERLGVDDPRISRALSNQADLAARSGRPDRALAMVRQAIHRRRREQGLEGRRRLHLSEQAMVIALGESGQVGHAVKLASRLSAETIPGYRGRAEDLYLEGRVLRQAGRYGEALNRLRAADAAAGPPERSVPFTRRNLEALADEVRCQLALHSPGLALDALAPVLNDWNWYARRLSARLTFELVALSAQADWLRLKHDEAVETLREFRETARSWGGFCDDDPLFDEFGRALVQILRNKQDLTGARAELREIQTRERQRIETRRLYSHHPWVAATRLELAECDEAEGLTDAAAGHYASIRDNPIMDEGHPLRLAACLGLTRLTLARGDRAAALAIMRALPDPDEWPLDPDIDVSEEASRLRRKLGL